MRILRWISGNVRKNRIHTKELFLKIWVAPIDEKKRESHLKLFIHIQRRVINVILLSSSTSFLYYYFYL